MEERQRPGVYQELAQAECSWTKAIEVDLPRTMPDTPLFDEEQQQSLLRVLRAYANFDRTVGYCQGMNFVAGLLMMVAQGGHFRDNPRLEKEEEIFWVLVCLMQEGRLGGFYQRQFPLLRKYLWALDELMAASLPSLREHFAREGVQHAVYLHSWFLTLYVNCAPLEMVLAFWDAVVCIGLESILGITVSLLREMQGTLLSLPFEDIVRLFKALRWGAHGPGFDAAAVGQMLVVRGAAVGLPPLMAARLREPLPCPRMADEESPVQRSESLNSPAVADAAPDAAQEEGRGHQPDTTLLGYLRQLEGGVGEFSWELSQGVRELPRAAASWLEDARDGLQRAGLGVPPARRPAAGAAASRPEDARGEAPPSAAGRKVRAV